MRCFLIVSVILILMFPVVAQDLDEKDVKVTLDQAMPIALKKAKTDFPDLDKYILNSVTARALLGDKNGGLFWQFLWKDRDFPHEKSVIVRVYMRDGLTISQRDDGPPRRSKTKSRRQ